MRSRACACCWSIRKRAAWGSARAWSTNACVSRAQAGYKKITLWTHSILTAARHVYEKAGFTLTSSENKHSWGKDVVPSIGIWNCKRRLPDPGLMVRSVPKGVSNHVAPHPSRRIASRRPQDEAG